MTEKVSTKSKAELQDVIARFKKTSSSIVNLPDLSFAVKETPITPENEQYDYLLKLIEDEYEDEAAVAIILAANGFILPEKYQKKLLEGFTDYLEHKGEKDLETSLFGRSHRLKFATRQSRKNKYQHYFNFIDYSASEYGTSAMSSLSEYLNDDDQHLKETIYREYMAYKKSLRDKHKK